MSAAFLAQFTSLAATGSLADPAGTSPFVAAVAWLEGTVLGTIATSVALIAVAGVGMMMLVGRVPLRRGATVLAGCFILFGAPVIAAGIRGAVGSGQSSPMREAAGGAPSPLSAVPASPQANSPGYDPYAGAAVPPR